VLFAGVWLVAAQIPRFKLGSARTIVAGIALTIGAGLVIPSGVSDRASGLASRP